MDKIKGKDIMAVGLTLLLKLRVSPAVNTMLPLK